MAENEIIKTEETSIIAKEQFLPSDSLENIKYEMIASGERGVKDFLSNLLVRKNIIKDLKKIIDPGKEYIVEIPKSAKDGLENGTLDFMREKETGTPIATLVNQKNKRITNILKIREDKVPVDSTQLMNSLNVVSIKQDIEKLTKLVEDINNKLDDINNRFDEGIVGSIKGEVKNLENVKNIRDIETRRQICTNAIDTLSKSREICIQRICTLVNSLEDVSDKDIKMIFKIWKDVDFVERETKKYFNIQQMFYYVLICTQMLGYAYYLLDEPVAIENIFKLDDLIFDDEKLKKISQTEKLFDNDFSNEWYRNPNLYVGRIKEAVLEAKNTADYQISFTGKQVLEVIETKEQKG